MDNIREQIYLAALLHDIGKFYQRADTNLSDKENTLSHFSKTIAEDICPINDNGRFGYQHVIWTNEFLESIRDKLKQIPDIFRNPHGDNSSEDSLISIACNHHKPKTEIQAIVTLADWWSAGIDRTDPTTLERNEYTSAHSDNIKWGRQRYKHIPLYSVFNNINNGNYNFAFSLNPLSLDENHFFPKSINTTKDGVCQEEYTKLWNRFKTDFDKLPSDSFEGFAESLLYLLKKYTWCIPSNTMDMANVSLYEHLKTTAAFADALYLYKVYNPSAFNYDKLKHRLSICGNAKPILLLGGDLSGIQKFIYNISSRKAAVSLKGRSFYLQLLIDSIIQRIITHPDIDCTIGQVVYSSGGKFHMLLPNTEKVKSAINSLKEEFETELWKEHFGQLTLNLDYVPFCYNDNLKTVSFDGAGNNSTIGDLWKELADRLSKCKYQKLKLQISNRYQEFFEPQEITQFSICSVTGIEGKCVPIDGTIEENDKTYVLESVKKQADLGNVLKDVDYIVTYKNKGGSSYIGTNAKFDIEITGIHNYLFDQEELTKNDADFRTITSADVCRVKRINETNFLGINIKGRACSYGYQFYGGNKQAQKKSGSIKVNKTFEELAENTYLGILRMDVDGLGSIFVNGLPKSARSFAAYSTLSFMLDYFFSGYLNTIRSKSEFIDNVNIIYSGGDDIFAVGRWDKLISFAENVRTEFREFLGRDDISISAGISLVSDKFPISKGAQMAGYAEDSAKSFTSSSGISKNAINLFGENISWSTEYEFVKRYKKLFTSLIDTENMPHSILHRLMLLCTKMKRGDPSYLWHTAYFLKRFSEGKSDKIREVCIDLSNQLLHKRKYELISISARWTELELRITKK